MSDRVPGSSACSLRYRSKSSYIAVSVQPHPLKNRFGLHVSAVISWVPKEQRSCGSTSRKRFVLVIWMLPALTHPHLYVLFPTLTPTPKSSSSFPAPQLEMKAREPRALSMRNQGLVGISVQLPAYILGFFLLGPGSASEKHHPPPPFVLLNSGSFWETLERGFVQRLDDLWSCRKG